MAIKVNIPNGQNTASISGLYQWDYGQELEIESTDLGNMVGEVHFACSSMSEAIVVSCNFTNGIATVTIPNECLEQSSAITAWVYEISGTQGRTRKTVTIHVTSRTRPSTSGDIPTEIFDKYTELITQVNDAIDGLEDGTTIVKKAQTAENADKATSAVNAGTANYAVSAKDADHAVGSDSATKANTADTAEVLTPTVLKNVHDDKVYVPVNKPGVYVVSFEIYDNQVQTGIIVVPDLDRKAIGTVVDCKAVDNGLDGTAVLMYSPDKYNLLNTTKFLIVTHPNGTTVYDILPIVSCHRLAEI